MVDDFTDMMNEIFAAGRHSYSDSDGSEDLPNIDDLLFSVKGTQEQHEVGKGPPHLTRRSDESLGHMVEVDWKESNSFKSG